MARTGQDDLGLALLAGHPRSEQWRELDVTVSALTFEQVAAMAGEVEPDSAAGRVRARAAVLAGLDEETAGRLGSRWVRWCSTFGLGPPPHHDQDRLMRFPFELVDRTPDEDPWGGFVRGCRRCSTPRSGSWAPGWTRPAPRRTPR